MKSRRGVNVLLSVFVALVLAMPLAAHDAGTKNAKPTSATMDVLSNVLLGGKQIKPGTYVVTADDSKVTVAQGRKVIAEAPVQWKDETSKAKYSNIIVTDNQVKEIHFGGKMRYVEIAEQGAMSGQVTGGGK